MIDQSAISGADMSERATIPSATDMLTVLSGTEITPEMYDEAIANIREAASNQVPPSSITAEQLATALGVVLHGQQAALANVVRTVTQPLEMSMQRNGKRLNDVASAITGHIEDMQDVAGNALGTVSNQLHSAVTSRLAEQAITLASMPTGTAIPALVPQSIPGTTALPAAQPLPFKCASGTFRFWTQLTQPPLFCTAASNGGRVLDNSGLLYAWAKPETGQTYAAWYRAGTGPDSVIMQGQPVDLAAWTMYGPFPVEHFVWGSPNPNVNSVWDSIQGVLHVDSLAGGSPTLPPAPPPAPPGPPPLDPCRDPSFPPWGQGQYRCWEGGNNCVNFPANEVHHDYAYIFVQFNSLGQPCKLSIARDKCFEPGPHILNYLGPGHTLEEYNAARSNVGPMMCGTYIGPFLPPEWSTQINAYIQSFPFPLSADCSVPAECTPAITCHNGPPEVQPPPGCHWVMDGEPTPDGFCKWKLECDKPPPPPPPPDKCPPCDPCPPPPPRPECCPVVVDLDTPLAFGDSTTADAWKAKAAQTYGSWINAVGTEVYDAFPDLEEWNGWPSYEDPGDLPLGTPFIPASP